MNQVRILLTTPVNGYLDVKEGTAFPLNFSIGDIRDISKRTGSYSKTITLVGNKNNCNLLGHLYDINLNNGTFNINTLQECLVEQDGIVILDNMYMQLTSIKKVQKSSNYDYDVEFEVQIKDSSSDFFTKINDKLLTDLDFSYLNHTYNVLNITGTFNNTYIDEYKYMLPYKQSYNTLNNAHLNYDLKEFKPGFFARSLWDKIFDNAGYTYTFPQIDDQNVQFSKLYHPYNGDVVKQDENPDYLVQANNTSVISKTITGGFGSDAFSARVSPNGSNGPSQIIIDNEIIDPSNQYNPVTGIYTPAFAITNPSALNFKYLIDYEIDIIVSSGTYNLEVSAGGSSNGLRVKPAFITRNNTQGVENIQYFDEISIPIGAIYTSGSTVIGTGTIGFETSLSDLTTISQVVQKLYLSVSDTAVNSVYPAVWNNTSNLVVYPSYRIRITNIEMEVTPTDLPLDYNMEVQMNKLLPKGIKQSEYIKSICQMYNLFIEVNPNDKTNLIIKTRDRFYNDGETINWTKKLAKEQEQDIQFLPELSSKSIILTYKQDKDIANVGYFDSTNEVYGEVKIIFDNEYVRNIEKKELIFGPTPTIPTGFNAIVPMIDGLAPKTNLRILYDGGNTVCETYYIKQNTLTIAVNSYPFLSHFDKPYDPSFDINFGKCDFYFYDATPDTSGTGDVTDNNLYNSHWRRTFSQINNGKLLTAFFDLNSIDIQKLKLNDVIRIDNSYWNINKIIDYDANSNNLTKVELLSIDDQTLLEINNKTVTVLNPTDTPIIDVITDGVSIGPGKNNGTNTIINGYTDIKGTNNFVGPNNISNINGDNNHIVANGISTVNGNNNIVYSPVDIKGDNNNIDYAVTNSIVNGNNNYIEAGAINTTITGDNNNILNGSNNVHIFVNDYTATQSNLFVIPNDLWIIGDNPSINGVPLTGITTGWPGVLSIDNTSGIYNPVLTNGTSIGGGEDPSVAMATNILYLGDSTVSDGTWYLGDRDANLSEIRFDGTDAHFENATGYTRINGSDVRLDPQNNVIIVNTPTVSSPTDFLLLRDDTTGIITQSTLTQADLSGIATGWPGVLAIDNTSGPNDVIINTTQVIKSGNGGGQIDLDYLGSSNSVLISNDNGGYAKGVIYMEEGFLGNFTEISNYDGRVYSYSTVETLIENLNNGLYLTNTSVYLERNVGGTDRNVLQFSNGLGFSSADLISYGDESRIRLMVGGNSPGITLKENSLVSATSDSIDSMAVFIGTNNSTIGAGVVNSVIIGGGFNILDSNNSIILGGLVNQIEITSDRSAILAGDSGLISGTSLRSVILGGANNIIDNHINAIISGVGNTINTGSNGSIIGGTGNTLNATNGAILASVGLNSESFVQTLYNQDNYHDAFHTVTTTNNTITDLYTFTPSNGVYIIKWDLTAFENATGDALGLTAFATFKVIAGVVTQISTTTIDRKSNFPAAVNITVDTNGTLIRARVTGRTGSTIDWRGHLTITK